MLIALSTAARSGADTAYIYDKLIELHREKDFDDILSNLGSITLIASSGACLIGSMVTKFGMQIPFFGTILFYIISIVMLVNFKEPYKKDTESSTKMILKKNVDTVLKNKIILKFIVISVLIFPCYHILNQLLQPYLNINGIKVEYFGAFYTLLTIFESVGTKITAYLIKKIDPHKLIFFAFIVIIFGFMLMSVQSRILVYFIPALMGIAFGVYYTVNSIVVNKSIESEIRASLLSLQHALTKIMQMIMFALVGLLMNSNTTNTIFFYLSIFLAISVLILYTFLRKTSTARSNTNVNFLKEN